MKLHTANHYYLIFLLLTGAISYAQAPQGYYDSAQDLTGYELKTALYQIISGSHNPQPYSSHWSFFEANDVKEDGTVWDIYAECHFLFGTPDQGGNQDIGTGGNIECEFFNREHTFPTSWFGGNLEPMRSDILHIYPVDKYINNIRGNLVFANVGSADNVSSNGSKRGTSNTIGINGQVFEVADDYKGDIARSLFYMAVRYENVIAGWENNNVEGAKMLNGTTDQVFEDWAIQLLYEWHIQDPVSQKETDRNNAAFQYQGNRNPFVDYPDFVCKIWNINECELSSYTNTLQELITIYPNPSNTGTITIKTTVKTSTITLFNSIGQTVLHIDNPEFSGEYYQISSLPKGLFFLQLTSENQQIVKKITIK